MALRIEKVVGVSEIHCASLLAAYFGILPLLSLRAAELTFNSKEDFLQTYRHFARHDELPPMMLAVSVQEIKNGEKLPSRELHVFSNGPSLRVDDEVAQGKEVSRVANPLKSFRVARSDSHAQFLIEALHSDYSKEIETCRVTAPIVNPYYHFLEAPLLEFLERPEIEFESTREISDPGGDRELELTVSRTVSGASGKPDKWLYKFTFLPEHEWVLSKYRLVNGEYEVRFFHDFDRAAFPVISKVEIEDKSEGGYTYDATFNVTNVELGPPPQDTFTLAAFGIHNGVGEPQQTAFKYWLVAINVVLVLFILVFMWGRRKST